MRRLLILLLTFILAFSFCFPANAQYSFQSDTSENEVKETAESQTSEDTPIESESSETAVYESGTSEDSSETDETTESDSTNEESDNDDNNNEDSNTNESSDTNPIGDSSSYYKVGNLKNSPDITAESAIIMDATTGAILYTKEADTTRYPASITKVMTALLAIENCDMDDIVTFSSEAVNGIEAGSSSAGINVGAELTVEDTLYALMLVSANEAGAALAEHISGSDEAFAELMTSRAKELGCTGTNFTNPHGLPDENHYTTAHDMALIVKEALKHEEFRVLTSTHSYTLEASDTLTNTLELYNHAKILYESSEYYYEYAEGAKTGYTQAALNTLVTYAKKGDVELICVILKDYGADNSYYDTADLFTWAFKKVKSIQPLSSFDFAEALENSSIDSDLATNIARLNCSYDEDYYILVKKGFDEDTLTTSFVYDEDNSIGRIGYINIYSEDTLIGTTPVTFDTTTEAAQNYLSNGETGDDLETAPVDEDSFTPKKLFSYLLRIIIAIILVIIIMGLIRTWEAEKRRKERIKNRKKKHSSSNTRTNNKTTSSHKKRSDNSYSSTNTNGNSSTQKRTNTNHQRRNKTKRK